MASHLRLVHSSVVVRDLTLVDQCHTDAQSKQSCPPLTLIVKDLVTYHGGKS